MLRASTESKGRAYSLKEGWLVKGVVQEDSGNDCPCVSTVLHWK